MFQVMFSIIAMEFFKLKAEQNGYLMAYFGMVQMVSERRHLLYKKPSPETSVELGPDWKMRCLLRWFREE